MQLSNYNARDYDMAEWYCERIESKIQEFQESLGKDQAMLARVVLLDGTSITPTWFGYHNPNMLIIEGVDSQGNEVEIMTHHSVSQIVLTKVPKGSEGSRSIGFQVRDPDRQPYPSCRS